MNRLLLLIPHRPSGSRLAVKAAVTILALALAGGADGDPARFHGGLHTAPVTITLPPAPPGSMWSVTTDGSRPVPGTRPPTAVGWRIESNVVLRATAFIGTNVSLDLGAATHLFPESLFTQTGRGFPPTWGTNQGRDVPADYAMDPRVVGGPDQRAEAVRALRSLPVLAVTIAPDDLWSPATGIYAHPQATGDDWERPAFLEFFPRDTSPGFRIGAGIRIQGGWNRRPEESPKHSFRLSFRKRFGAARLSADLFGGGVTNFEHLILRGGNNNSWLHWSGVERRQAEYLRDAWMRESYAALGQVSARGAFVHLTLNGLYWGIYNLTERPSGPFVAAHLGGRPRDYDVRNSDNLLSGDGHAWSNLFHVVNSGPIDAARYEAIGRALDLPAFIDYLILNLYGANGDWDRASNWYAARRRDPPGPFRFFVWDGERTLEKIDDNRLADDDDQSPTRLFQRLRTHAAFREAFARRAGEVLGEGGPLSPGPAGARYARLAALLDSAILLESARWGDYRATVHPYKEGPYERYTREDHWRPEVRRLLNDYFPRRSAVMMRQLREAGLHP